MKINEFVTEDEALPSVNTPTVGEIAEKFGYPMSSIMDQLRKGIDVEYEHTKDAKIAKEIALDHLWEMPDYYDRLEDMERNK
jgi:hypothetical protein